MDKQRLEQMLIEAGIEFDQACWDDDWHEVVIHRKDLDKLKELFFVVDVRGNMRGTHIGCALAEHLLRDQKLLESQVYQRAREAVKRTRQDTLPRHWCTTCKNYMTIAGVVCTNCGWPIAGNDTPAEYFLELLEGHRVLTDA